MMTPKQIRHEAVGTLAGWLTGYTEPDENGLQHKVKLMDSDENSILISVEEHRIGPVETQVFRVDVRVQKEDDH